MWVSENTPTDAAFPPSIQRCTYALGEGDEGTQYQWTFQWGCPQGAL